MVKKILVKLLLGKRKQYFSIVEIKGQLMKVVISRYENREERRKIAINNGVFMADEFKAEDSLD